MTIPQRLPACILGGDPFNQFRFLYRRDLLWKLFDEEYCYMVMKAFHEAGGIAFDLSFDVNVRLFNRLLKETGEKLIGFGNPTWEQGIFLNGRYIQYSRDRIMRTLVERLFPRDIARLVDEKLSHDDVLVFGYDRSALPLDDGEISSIHIDQNAFSRRLGGLSGCQYIMLGGADADWLISLGRTDLVLEMIRLARQSGFIPLVLTQFPSYTLPQLEAAGCDAEGYVVPLNREWSWFDRDACLSAVKAVKKPVVAFMALAHPSLTRDPRAAFDWLYRQAGVESILFGTATTNHARQTPGIAQAARDAADMEKKK